MAAAVMAAMPVSLPVFANTIEEIVVTARKRSENLQDVPAAVSAFTGDELVDRQIDRIEEIQRLTPNLTVNEASGLNPGAVQVFIRGIGSDPGFDQGVGIYVDDVYLNRTFGAMLELYDVERIEVLKGPQGHLYGRNTIGGALKYVTRIPTDETRAMFEAKVGTDSLQKIKAGASGALGDNLYGSIAVISENRDGYQTNLFDGDDYGSSDKQGARGTLVWDASEDVTVKFTADYFNDTSDPLVPTRIAVNAANVQNVFQALLGLGNLFVPGSAYLAPGATLDVSLPSDEDHVNTAHTTNGFDLFEIESRNYSLTVDWDINENWSLKSVTAMRDQDNVAPYDFDGSDQVFIHTLQPASTEDVSQEFQFNYQGENINAVVGLYYLDAERDGSSETQQTAFLRLLTDHHKVFTKDIRELKSRSFYANIDWDINEQWQLSLGGRYTKDERDTDRRATVTLTQHPVAFTSLTGPAPLVLNDFGAQIFQNLPFFQFFIPHFDNNGNFISFGNSTSVITYPENNLGSAEWSEFTPSAKIRYRHSDDLMVYAGYSSGFKAGGFLPSGRQEIMPTFDPELVDTYSIGLKSTLAGGRIRLNAELFLNDYQDKQVAVVILDENGALTQTSDNVGEVESTGGEIEILWLPPVDGLSVNLNVGWLDVDIDELIDVLPDGVTVGNAADFRELGFSPELTWQARVQYDFEVGSSGSMTFAADVAFRDEMYTDSPVDISNAFFEAGAYSDDLTTYNASLTYRSADERWRVTLEGKNLGDERSVVNTFNVTDFTLGGYNRGRTWGLTFAYSFK